MSTYEHMNRRTVWNNHYADIKSRLCSNCQGSETEQWTFWGFWGQGQDKLPTCCTRTILENPTFADGFCPGTLGLWRHECRCRPLKKINHFQSFSIGVQFQDVPSLQFFVPLVVFHIVPSEAATSGLLASLRRRHPAWIDRYHVMSHSVIVVRLNYVTSIVVHCLLTNFNLVLFIIKFMCFSRLLRGGRVCLQAVKKKTVSKSERCRKSFCISLLFVINIFLYISSLFFPFSFLCTENELQTDPDLTGWKMEQSKPQWRHLFATKAMVKQLIPWDDDGAQEQKQHPRGPNWQERGGEDDMQNAAGLFQLLSVSLSFCVFFIPQCLPGQVFWVCQ